MRSLTILARGAVLIGALSMCVLGSCTRGTEASGAKPVIFVSIQPQRYFVERIVGDAAEVKVMVPANGNPHSYEPTPQQVQDLGRAAVYFSIDVEFEHSLLSKIREILPSMPVVDISAGIARRQLEEHVDEGETEDHEGEEVGHEDENGLDPHVWLSPELVRRMVVPIRETLSDLFPDHADTFAGNATAFDDEIVALQAEIRMLLSPLENKVFFVYHPAFGYFADEFGLVQEAVETGGSEPTPQQLSSIITEARDDGVKTVFVQPQFPETAARSVAEAIGGTVVRLNDLDPAWLENMRAIANALHQGIQ